MSLEVVRERVDAACRRAGRDPDDVTLLVVSKGRPVEAVSRLYAAGQRDFGENRVDELVEKADLLPKDIRWHFVGHLQSRKARSVRPLATYLHSLDRDSLAKGWLKGAGAPPPCYLQVNIGREPQKYGLDPEAAVEAALRFDALGLPLVGLMAILPIVAEPEAARPYFRDLAQIGAGVAARVPSAVGLSMGMTDDFEVAVEEGATVIRVGRAIFEGSHRTI